MFEKIKILIVSLFIIASGIPVVAAVQEPMPAAATLDREAVIEAAKEITTNAYPNANDVVLDEHIRVRYTSTGAAQTWDDEYVKILTKKGRRERQTLSLHFNAHYSEVSPLLIEIIKPDGSVVDVDIEKQSRVMIDRSQMGSNIYDPNNKIMQITLPGLEVGDICHYRIMRNEFKARMANTWSDYMVFEYTAPIRRIVYEVDAPADLPIEREALKDAVKGTAEYSSRTVDGGHTRHRWVVRDVPRMYEEPNMPPLHTVVQRLLVSTIPDWETVSRWYWELSKPRLQETTPEMRSKVDELVAGAATDMEKVRRLFKFVSQEVRYMGITTEETAPGYEPHDVSITFKNRYGVCRDKAALLAAMLRMAGLNGYPVLIYVGPKKDEEVPQPYFNHAITAVELAPGEYTLMDPTDESTRDMLPNYLCNKSYLVAKPDGDTLQTSPIVPATQNLMRVTSKGKLDSNNKLTVETELHFDGVNDSIYRGFFARKKPEDLRRFFEARIKSSLPGAKLHSFDYKPKNLMDTETPLQASLSFACPDYPVASQGIAMLPPPWAGKSIGAANFILQGTGLETREYPLTTDIACGIDETFEIDVADSKVEIESLPEDVDVDTEKTAYSQKYEHTDGKITGHGRLLLKAVEYLPDEYLELKDLLAEREIAKKHKPFGISSSGFTRDPDVKILAANTEIAIEDSQNWKVVRTIRKEILTYGGKKENSEIKIDYNPAWEEVTVETAKVTAPDGTVQTLAEEELNIMDAAWVGSAPRYPAGKTLVASLPGVEIGSTVETRIVLKSRGKPFFSLNWNANGYNPVEDTKLSITAPDDLALDIFTPSNRTAFASLPKHRVETENNTKRYLWENSSLKGLKEEDHIPPWWAFNPTVFISNGDWSNYADRLKEILNRATSKQTACVQHAKKLKTSVKGRNELIRAIRDYVAENINSAGPALHELPLSAITPADTTLAEGYGNTTDRAVVIYALAEAAKLKPEFVLASSWGSRLESVRRLLIEYPQRNLFNTLLVRLDSEEGPIYLNDTNQYAELGTTRFDGKPGLTLAGDVFEIQAQPGKENRTYVGYEIEIDSNGDAQMKYTKKYFGTSFAAFHRKFAEMPPEERRLFFQELVSGISQSARATSELATRYDRYPGKLSFSADVKSFAVKDGSKIYFEIPRHLDSTIAALSESRAFPFYRPSELLADAEYTISLPANTEKIWMKPGSIDWEGPANIGAIDYSTQMGNTADGGKQLRISRAVALNPALVPSINYAQLLEINQMTRKPESWTVMVELDEQD